MDDGTVTRLADDRYRWTAAHPNLRWLVQNAIGLDVQAEDVSDDVAALALQGARSRALLQEAGTTPIAGLKYFRATSGEIAGVPVDVSRTGYIGDLGYELWDAVGSRPRCVGRAGRGRSALRSAPRSAVRTSPSGRACRWR